jgi:hypothetical protein
VLLIFGPWFSCDFSGSDDTGLRVVALSWARRRLSSSFIRAFFSSICLPKFCTIEMYLCEDSIADDEVVDSLL